MTKNKKFLGILILILIFQIMIPVMFIRNEAKLKADGRSYRFRVAKVDENYDYGFISVTILTMEEDDIYKVDYSTVEENPHVYTNNTSYVYKVDGNYLGQSYITPIKYSDLEKGDNYIATNTLIYPVETPPTHYIEGDDLKNLQSTDTAKDDYAWLEAEVIVKDGSYLIKELYINKVPYRQYYEDHFFDLLDHN